MNSKFVLLAALASVVWGGLVASAQGTSRSQWDGVYTEAQAARGKELYLRRCVLCHVDDLSGGEPEEFIPPAPSLIDSKFDNYWNQRPVAELYNYIHTKMPMDEPGALLPQQVSDLISFIFNYRKYPAGTTELPGNEAALKSIVFIAKKPGA